MGSLILYVRKLKSASQKEIQADLAQRLIGQAETILGCLPRGPGKFDEDALANVAGSELKPPAEGSMPPQAERSRSAH